MPPGHTNNPNGRPPGRVNKRTQAVLDLIHERGDTDPLVALSDIVTKNQDPSIVAQAANILAPYVHSKRGTIPAPRFVDEPIEVPQFTTIDQAEDFLALIAQRAGKGELELQSATDICGMVRHWIEAKLAHTATDLKVAAQGGGDATIHITGGMPDLPGTSILMDTTPFGAPAINGHQGPSIEHQPSEAEPDQVQATIPVHGSVEPAQPPDLTDSSDTPE